MKKPLKNKAKSIAKRGDKGYNETDIIAEKFREELLQEARFIHGDMDKNFKYYLLDKKIWRMLQLRYLRTMQLRHESGKTNLSGIFKILKKKIKAYSGDGKELYENYLVRLIELSIEVHTDNLKRPNGIADWMMNEIVTRANEYEEKAYRRLLTRIALDKKLGVKRRMEIMEMLRISNMNLGSLAKKNNEWGGKRVFVNSKK